MAHSIRRFVSLSLWPKPTIAGLGLLALGVLFLVDSYTPPDQSFILFYLVPIFLLAWYVGRKAGILMALAAAAAWISSDEVTGGPHSHPLVPYWNIAVKTALLLAMAFHFSRMRRGYEQEKQLARVDLLTGVANRRAFMEMLTREISRAHRTRNPLTVAYVDIDNFKQINDQRGHEQGDAVLAYVGHALSAHLRATDIVARIGGDEFAILIPASSAAQASKAVEKMHALLSEGVQERDWPVTFSIGVTTFIHPPPAADDIVKRADELMYGVKKREKNALSHAIF